MAKISDIIKTAKFADGCPSPSSSPPHPGIAFTSTLGINGCKESIVSSVKFFHFFSMMALSSLSDRDDGILLIKEEFAIFLSEI